MAIAGDIVKPAKKKLERAKTTRKHPNPSPQNLQTSPNTTTTTYNHNDSGKSAVGS